MILFRQGPVSRGTVIVTCLFIMASLQPIRFATASETTPGIRISHDPIEYFVPGSRIMISATIEHPAGIQLVRCYFKEISQADFVFVSMEPAEKNLYQGILPATSLWTTAIQYSILAVTNENKVFKTEIFAVPATVDENPTLPLWQQIDSTAPLLIKTELTEAPAAVSGFTDNLKIDVVESGLRFGGTGTVVGATAAESTAVNAHWAQAFGKTATKKLWYQQWWVWAGAAVVAGTTVAVVAGGDSGGKSDSNESGSVVVSW